MLPVRLQGGGPSPSPADGGVSHSRSPLTSGTVAWTFHSSPQLSSLSLRGPSTRPSQVTTMRCSFTWTLALYHLRHFPLLSTTFVWQIGQTFIGCRRIFLAPLFTPFHPTSTKRGLSRHITLPQDPRFAVLDRPLTTTVTAGFTRRG